MDWIWFSIGAILLMIELFIGSFVVLCFGLGALAYSAVLFFLPHLTAGSFPIGLIIVSLSSLAAIVMTRRHLTKRHPQQMENQFETMQGKLVIHEGQPSIFVQGSFWQIADQDKITDLNLCDGDTVWVRQIENNQVVILSR